ncbi:hypothetical protein, partial [Microbacterium sp. ZKA21]|uniref:hypothetical protein n=1 Tax=Microbacterium sp. ZKA21 TaxID=3381694 RepID=UPI003D1C6205
MLVRQLRILFDQLRRHRQMTSHLLGVLLAQGLELVACRPLQITSGDLVGNVGTALGARTVVIGPVVVRTLSATTGRTRAAATVVTALVAALTLLIPAFTTVAIALLVTAGRTITVTTLVPTRRTITITTLIPTRRTITITTLIPTRRTITITTLIPTRRTITITTLIPTRRTITITTLVPTRRTIT